MDIAEKIIALRKQAGLTQKELGKIAGVSGAAVSTWELGEKSPKIGPLHKICSHFGIDIYSFIDQNSDTYKMEKPTPVYKSGPLSPDDAHIMDMIRQLTPENKKKFAEKLEVLIEFQSPPPGDQE